jgi:uridine phosphorylase
MSPLFGDFTKHDWSEVFSVPPEAAPQALIVHGEVGHEHNLARWAEILGPQVLRPQWNVLLGDYENTNLAFANVLGGPMAAMAAHPCCVMGAELIIQTGYFGGLCETVDYGEIFIVDRVKASCGTAGCYGFDEGYIAADEELVEQARNYCEAKGWPYKVGALRSTDAIFLETIELARAWADDGQLGVDMETSTTFSVARHHSCRPISLLNLSDHMLRGEHYFEYKDRRRELGRKIDRRIRELALHLATTQTHAKP